MKLSIVIPALNEEQSIESIINRTLDAKQYITAHSPVTDLEITVVSDGLYRPHGRDSQQVHRPHQTDHI